MAKLIKIANPFEPWNGREIRKIEDGTTVQKAIEGLFPAPVDVVVLVNGREVEEATKLKDSDVLVITPVVGKGGGGKILGMVLAIAVTIAAGAAGAAFANTVNGVTTWTTASYIAAAATMFIGSALVNRVVGTNVDTGSFDSYENNPTYSWSGVSTTEGQNNPISITYGTVKSAGQSIGKYVNSVNDTEYLNWLVAAGEGPLTITDIKLNDNDIAYYSDLTCEIREGTNDQAVIENFNDTYFSKQLGYELTTTERIDECQGNATEGIIVKIEFSNGLYYANDDGGLDTAWVDVKGEFKSKTGTDWMPLFNARISGAQTSALRREFRLDRQNPDTYLVRVKVTGRSHSTTNSRAAVKCYWSELTSVVYDDFSYPNIALLGLKIKATDQISGSPSLEFLKTREYVWVWVPSTGQYEQKDATNPAWASYDMLHQAARLKNVKTGEYEFEVRGVPARYILYDMFSEWATFCDKKKLYINIEINSLGEMLETINKNIANVGRGIVLRFGTRYGCTWDCVKEPVQMFGMGNIIAGSFQEEFLQTSDRANCVELTYTDAANDYNRETITVYSDSYDTDVEEKTAEATFNGITSYEQAYREGMYQLYSNKYLLRTVSFEASVDAIACTIGDVILVAHDVPKWAKSGRIYKVEGQTLTLPVELSDITKQYRIMYRTLSDTLHSSNVKILSNGNGWCSVKLDTDIDDNDPPRENDVFDLAVAEIGSKPFVVKSITRAQDFTRKITCMEYNEALYNEDYSIPPIQYSSDDNKLLDVTSLRADVLKYTASNGVTLYKLGVAWERQSAGKFSVYYSVDSTTWELIGTGIDTTHYSTELSVEAKYVKVCATNGAWRTQGVIVETQALDLTLPPDKVTGFKYKNVMGGVQLSWDANGELDLKGYRVYVGEGDCGIDGCEIVLNDTNTTSIYVPLDTATNYTAYILAVDTSGITSDEPAVLTIAIQELEPVTGFFAVKNGDTVQFFWDEHKGYNFELRWGTAWGTGKVLAKLKANVYTAFFPLVGTQTFCIKTYNDQGLYSKEPMFLTIDLTPAVTRNIIAEFDEKEEGWPGVKNGVSVDGSNLVLDDLTGEYITEIQLNRNVEARNWIEYRSSSLKDLKPWSAVEDTWAEANWPWEKDDNQNPVKVDNYICYLNEEEKRNYLYSFSLNGNTEGAKIAESVSYRNARFRKGAVIADQTDLGYEVKVPAVFNLSFNAVHTREVDDHIVYMTLAGEGISLRLDYTRGQFILIGSDGVNVTADLKAKGNAVLNLYISQTDSERILEVSSLLDNKSAGGVEPAEPLGSFTEMRMRV